MQEPLTPSHLLTGRRVMSLPDGPYNSEFDDDVSVRVTDLTRRMIYLNKVLEHFWTRWKKEYLLELRDSHRHVKHPPKESNCGTISVGDIVLVHEDNRPRGFWKVAKVESLIKGADGLTRGAIVKVHSSGKRSTLLRRPVQLLCPLEVHQCCDAVDSDASIPAVNDRDPLDHETEVADSGGELEPTQGEPRCRSKRTAARNAREMIRIQAEDS